MKMRAIVETVFIGTDGVNLVTVTEDGVAIPLDNVTRMVITLVNHESDADESGADITVDSGSLPTDVAVKWAGSLAVGEIEFGIGQMPGVEAGFYDARVMYYDPQKDDGVYLVHEKHPTSQLRVQFV